MAVKFEFVSAFICERVLMEADGVTSAIRIVDIFFVPEGAPEEAIVPFYLIVLLKTVPVPDEEIRIGVTLIRANGERERLPDPPGQPFKLQLFSGDPSIPGGFSLILHANIKPRNMGTCFLEIDVDGEPVTRVPFTLRRPIQAEQKN